MFREVIREVRKEADNHFVGYDHTRHLRRCNTEGNVWIIQGVIIKDDLPRSLMTVMTTKGMESPERSHSKTQPG